MFFVRLVAIVLLSFTGHLVAGEPLIFSATGCGPYAPDEEGRLVEHIALVSNDGKSEFLVHLGDIVTGKQKVWPESQYAKVADILKTSKKPVVIVPGDNEWNDLLEPHVGWANWTKHFSNFEKHFDDAPRIARQQIRPENFAWTSKGVLIVGLNLVGGRVHDSKEWQVRHAQNSAWVKEQLTRHGKDVHALVVLAQAAPVASHESFFRPFVEQVKTWGKPTLYLHADGHKWEMHPRWRADNLLRVQTDQVARNPPVLVKVTDDLKAPFQFMRREK